jgi:uncharacterized membrane protein
MAMELLDGETRERDYALERQMMLSDGVFAIAMTLMALELRTPQNWDHTVGGLFAGSWPLFFAYGMSFFAISIFWAMHRQSFGRFRRSDFMLTALGLLALGCITVIPFATRLYSEDALTGAVGDGGARFYLGTFFAASLFSALTWGWACLKRDILDPSVGPRARIVVFLITLINVPVLTSIGVWAGDSRRPWLFLLLAAIGGGIGFVRRWAGRADAAAAGTRAHG